MIKRSLFLILIPIFMLSGCADILETRTEILTSGTWEFQSISNPDFDSDTQELYTGILSLATLTYLADGTYEVEFEPNTFEDYTGTWSFNDDASVITIEAGTSDEEDFNVIDLSEGLFRYTYQDSLGTSTVTYVK
ncbi:MAG: hypothetical protein AAF804_17450 [Bacteroidota bacterium]